MSELNTALARQRWKHQIFPSLLLVVEERPTWKARAAALNNAGLTTFYGKPWTKQNVHKLFYSYWLENEGHYSWNSHGKQLKDVEATLSNTPDDLAA